MDKRKVWKKLRKPVCSICSVFLSSDNWYPSQRKNNDYRCITCSKERSRRYYLANRGRLIKKNTEWNKQHPEKARLSIHKSYMKIKDKIFQLLGNKCVNCGFQDKRAFQIDHVFGGGWKEIKSLPAYAYYKNVLRKLEKGSKDYQLLCANCNQIKKYEKSEFPNVK